jgi:hypothetical protein
MIAMPPVRESREKSKIQIFAVIFQIIGGALQPLREFETPQAAIFYSPKGSKG